MNKTERTRNSKQWIEGGGEKGEGEEEESGRGREREGERDSMHIRASHDLLKSAQVGPQLIATMQMRCIWHSWVMT